jgi:hypothetical protein
VLWTEHAGPRWCSAVHAQRATVDGHDSYQGTQRRERGSNRPCTAQWRNRRSPSVADATTRSPPASCGPSAACEWRPMSVSVPPHSSIRGDLQPVRQPPGPATSTSRASAYRLRTGVDRSGDGCRPGPCRERGVRDGCPPGLPKGVRTWRTNPASSPTCGTG